MDINNHSICTTQSQITYSNQSNLQNPYAKFIYAIRSPETKKKYPKRFQAFLDFIQIDGKDIEGRLLNFYTLAKQNPQWLQDSLMGFITEQKERVFRGEIGSSTISNYYKPVKLFCDMNDILINWKLVSRGIPKSRHASMDRAPTIKEIRTLLNYSDIRIKPIVILMLTSGIRIGAWDYLKWKHIIPIKNQQGNTIAAKVIVYAGEPEQYTTFTTLEGLDALNTWMEYRASYGEKISGDSWLMRNLWKTTNMPFGSRTGSARNPIQLKNEAIRSILCRALLQQNIREELKDGQRRHEFKASHGLRKYFQTQITKVMRPADIGLLMGWDLGLTSSYYRTTEKDLLQDYLKVVDLGLLTVDEKYMLKRELSNFEQKSQEEASYISIKLQERNEEIRKIREEAQSKDDVLNKVLKKVEALENDLNKEKKWRNMFWASWGN